MNNNKFLTKAAWVTLTVLALSSCKSDVWEEHYSINSDVPTMTLAQTIESMPEYSNFVKALKSTYTFNGKKMTNVTYWDMLNESNFLTVWLPTDESLDSEVWKEYTKPVREKSQEDHLMVGSEFLGNHIARFSHTVGAATDKKDPRIMMLSGKGYESSSLSIAGTDYKADGKNIRCSNGIIHKLDGKIEYLPNIYDYLTTNPEYQDFGNWFKQYTKYEIDTEKSVERGIVDGQMEYADSVLKKNSVLLEKYGYIDEEDSNYIVLLPTRAVLDSQYDRIKDYFQYEELREDHDSLQKFYTYQAMMTDMFFNMSQFANPHPDDSIVSTLFKQEERLSENIPYHVYDPAILNDADSVIMCSNGKVYLFDEWPFQDKMTFLRPIKVEAEDVLLSSEFSLRPRTIYQDMSGNVLPTPVRVMDVSVNGLYSWDAPYWIDDNLKANYILKIVFRRNTVMNRSYCLYPVLRYYSQQPSMDADKETKAILWEKSTGKKKVNIYVCGDKNDENQVESDTVVSTSFAFPNCNYKTGRDRCKVTISSKMTSNQTDNMTSNVWIDCIILEPVTE